MLRLSQRLPVPRYSQSGTRVGTFGLARYTNARPGQHVIRTAALAPVVRIQTSHRVPGLLDGAGQMLAEVATDHVPAEPADGPAASRDQIEPELVTARPALLTAIGQQLRRAGRPARRHRDDTAAGARLPAARRPIRSGQARQTRTGPGRVYWPRRPGPAW